jgi:hypothetical protein
MMHIKTRNQTSFQKKRSMFATAGKMISFQQLRGGVGVGGLESTMQNSLLVF